MTCLEADAVGLALAPWPHLVSDDYLPAATLAEAMREIAAEAYEYEIEPRGTGRIEFSLLKSRTMWRAVYAKRTLTLLESAFGVRLRLNQDNVLQLRRMNAATPAFPVHSDYTAGQDTIASFLYLSPGWQPRLGGYLDLFTDPDQARPHLRIAPLANRFVAFRTAQSSLARGRPGDGLGALQRTRALGCGRADFLSERPHQALGLRQPARAGSGA